MPTFTRQHYRIIADELRKLPTFAKSSAVRRAIAARFKDDNPNFDVDQFLDVATPKDPPSKSGQLHKIRAYRVERKIKETVSYVRRPWELWAVFEFEMEAHAERDAYAKTFLNADWRVVPIWTYSR